MNDSIGVSFCFGIVLRSAPFASTVIGYPYCNKGGLILILPDALESEYRWGMLTEPMESDEEHWYFRPLKADEFLDKIQRILLKKIMILPSPELTAILDEAVERRKRETETAHA